MHNKTTKLKIRTYVTPDDARKLVGWMLRVMVMAWWPEDKKKDGQGWPVWTSQDPPIIKSVFSLKHKDGDFMNSKTYLD